MKTAVFSGWKDFSSERGSSFLTIATPPKSFWFSAPPILTATS